MVPNVTVYNAVSTSSGRPDLEGTHFLQTASHNTQVQLLLECGIA